MHKLLVLAVAGLCFTALASSDAAELVSPPPAAAAPGDAGGASKRLSQGGGASVTMRQIPPSGPPILLEAGKGTLLRLSRPAATVFIANPDVADVQVKSPSLIYLSGKAPGETVVYAVDADDNVLLHAPIRVDHDLSRLRESMHVLMPGENISVNSVGNTVVLSGDVSTAGRARKAIQLATPIAKAQGKDAVIENQMAVATPNQVNLRVKIAEVNRTALKAMGVNWMARGTGNTAVQRFSTANPVTINGNSAENAITFGKTALSGLSFSATLDALTQEGLITTLAEPNLTALNGQTASFLAGGEFPVPVAATSSNGTPTISVDFKKFGVSVDFTPTILDTNHLNLKIRPEVSALSSSGAVSVPISSTATITIPALTVRRAETTVELGSGQSFALAGLLQNTTEQDVSKVPWLGDVPILGQLFRSDRFQHNETELVIIVTPYLVKPSSVALAAPTDGYVAPHDAQRVINSETYRQNMPGRPRGPVEPGIQGLIGPAGFRVD